MEAAPHDERRNDPDEDAAPAPTHRPEPYGQRGVSLWEALVDYDPAFRYYARLAVTREHEAWLLSWVPGQGTDWPDHGGSAGAFFVVRGVLTEEHAVLQTDETAVVASTRELGTGSLRPFGTRHIHRVTNTSPRTGRQHPRLRPGADADERLRARG